jgi:hypothetical protein
MITIRFSSEDAITTFAIAQVEDNFPSNAVIGDSDLRDMASALMEIPFVQNRHSGAITTEIVVPAPDRTVSYP